jgi:hypothetical protein
VTRPAFLISALLLVSCKHPPRVGETCAGATETLLCEANDRALSCNAGWWESIPCRGPKGCASGNPAFCDRSLGEPGDPCTATPGIVSSVCASDKRSQLACVDRRLAVERECKGPEGCRASGCDQSIGDVGLPCLQRELGACSSDGKAVLRCAPAEDRKGLVGETDGRFQIALECPTKNGCKRERIGTTTRYEPRCDFSGAVEGSACGKSNSGSEVCGPDGKSILRCNAGGQFETFKKCEQSRCVPGNVGCD